MSKGRRASIVAWALILNCLQASLASAGFFGFGSEQKDKSGLDFNRGYDVNTVATVSGRVTSLPHRGAGEQYLVEVKSGPEAVSVSVGPESFWDKKGIALRVNDEISAKGSKAQGADGKTYLLAQKLVNRTTGSQLEMRNLKGEPLWMGTSGGMGSAAGSMFRGGGMMRFGGGMMRH